jgi:hypothetical protein
VQSNEAAVGVAAAYVSDGDGLRVELTVSGQVMEGASVETHQVLTKAGTVLAFEIDVVFCSRRTVAWPLASVAGVDDIRPRKPLGSFRGSMCGFATTVGIGLVPATQTEIRPI